MSRIDCHFPDCPREGTHHFAQVPLCEQHREDIRHETAKFYTGSSNKEEAERRPLYYKVDHLISWSKRRLRRKNGDLV